MGLWSRRPADPPAPVVPWEGSGVRADVALRPAGRREVPSVVLTTGGIEVQLHVADVRGLLRGRTGVAESTGPQPAFLCRPESAAPGSVVHEAVAHLPAGSLVLVLAADRPEVVAGLDGAVLESFTAWGRDLPG